MPECYPSIFVLEKISQLNKNRLPIYSFQVELDSQRAGHLFIQATFLNICGLSYGNMKSQQKKLALK